MGNENMELNPAAWRDEMNKGGFKADADKPPIHLIYPRAIELEAAVFGFGAKKYAAYNWCKGMDYTRLISAAQRHLLAITRGEDLDPESNLPHAAHVRCCMAMLIGMMDLHPELDDRYGKSHA